MRHLLAQTFEKAHFLQVGRLTTHHALIKVALLDNVGGLAATKVAFLT
jgi:hypothetical protein